MEMHCVMSFEDVVINECYQEGDVIFLKTNSGRKLQYLGKYDLTQVEYKVCLGHPVRIAIDLIEDYCVLTEDLISQLR